MIHALKRFRWIVAVIGMVCIVVLVGFPVSLLHWGRFSVMYYSQDVNSFSVKEKVTLFGVPLRTRLKLKTDTFDSEKAVWTGAMNEKFPEPVPIGGWVLVRDSGVVVFYKLMALDEHNLKVVKYQYGDVDGREMIFRPGVRVAVADSAFRWSASEDGGVYVYSDRYYFMEQQFVSEFAFVLKSGLEVGDVKTMLWNLKFRKYPWM